MEILKIHSLIELSERFGNLSFSVVGSGEVVSSKSKKAKTRFVIVRNYLFPNKRFCVEHQEGVTISDHIKFESSNKMTVTPKKQGPPLVCVHPSTNSCVGWSKKLVYLRDGKRFVLHQIDDKVL